MRTRQRSTCVSQADLFIINGNRLSDKLELYFFFYLATVAEHDGFSLRGRLAGTCVMIT